MTSKTERFHERAEEAWPELAEADRARNAGMPMELISAQVYAEIDDISPEEYIIKVLRAERERRQAIDAVTRDGQMCDLMIESAAEAGMSVVDYCAQAYGHGRPPGTLSTDFLIKMIRRLEERAE